MAVNLARRKRKKGKERHRQGGEGRGLSWRSRVELSGAGLLYGARAGHNLVRVPAVSMLQERAYIERDPLRGSAAIAPEKKNGSLAEHPPLRCLRVCKQNLGQTRASNTAAMRIV